MSNDLSDAFKALGHPHRLTIVRGLLDGLACETSSPEACELDPAYCDFATIADQLGIGKSTISHHLKELDRAGLIERRREGRRLYCRINQERMRELRQFLEGTPALTSR